jgi:hypothetical protein
MEELQQIEIIPCMDLSRINSRSLTFSNEKVTAKLFYRQISTAVALGFLNRSADGSWIKDGIFLREIHGGKLTQITKIQSCVLLGI